MRGISNAIGNRSKDILTIYGDDFLIATKGTFQKHIRDIDKIFSVLQGENFKLK